VDGGTGWVERTELADIGAQPAPAGFRSLSSVAASSVSLGTSQVHVDGSHEMRLGQWGRVVTRVVMVATIVAAAVAGVAVLGEASVVQLNDIIWTYSGQ
jgi:hypothetical protein